MRFWPSNARSAMREGRHWGNSQETGVEAGLALEDRRELVAGCQSASHSDREDCRLRAQLDAIAPGRRDRQEHCGRGKAASSGRAQRVKQGPLQAKPQAAAMP